MAVWVGGRYDGLLKSLWPPAMGTPMGAVGVTLNVERLFALAAPQPKRGRPAALQASQVDATAMPSQYRILPGSCLRKSLWRLLLGMACRTPTRGLPGFRGGIFVEGRRSLESHARGEVGIFLQCGWDLRF